MERQFRKYQNINQLTGVSCKCRARVVVRYLQYS